MKKILTIILMLTTIIYYNSCSMAEAVSVRIKDIAHVEGIRDNRVIGYGLVVGLPGTGDNSRSTQLTNKLMLANLGTMITNENDIKYGNAAAVIVTATIPPFAKNGDKIDVVVSSMADAKSLEGGVLVETQLKAPNGEIVALAQGPISSGGVNASASGSKVRTSITTSARIPNGAIMERDMTTDIGDEDSIKLVLNRQNYTMVARIAQTINENVTAAKAIDGNTIKVFVPQKFQNDRVSFLSLIENLNVKASSEEAKVVINERTGTIVIGSDVKLLPAAIAHGNLTVTVSTMNEISQPNQFGQGATAFVQNSKISVNKAPGKVIQLQANSNLNELVRALNAIGVTPFDLISILQALKEAGSLEATIEII